MKTKALITGASGSVGLALLRALAKMDHQVELYAGVRDTDRAYPKLAGLNATRVSFDFTAKETYATALSDMDLLFLIRPPQISDVKSYFEPLITEAMKAAVRHIVFLSVQGVEKSTFIPHHGIERSIVSSGIAYTFLRPAYFMQNFLSALNYDLVQRQQIYLPAGNAVFTVVDVSDVGRVAAKVLTHPEQHINHAYDLTNGERLTFAEMADTLSDALGKKITYKSPSLLAFFINKYRAGLPSPLILVMIALHYLPRFQRAPTTTTWVRTITGSEATTFAAFVKQHAAHLQ